MTIESFQDSLFEDPIGLRFRHAREKARLSLEAVAQQLKLPVAVLDAIEREDWPRLGAPIFLRSYVGSYARLLGLPESLADEVVRGKPTPPLATIGGLSVSRGGPGGIHLGYLLMTVLIVAAVLAAAFVYQSPGKLAPLPAGEGEALPNARAGSGGGGGEAKAARFTVSSDGRIARH